MHCFISRDIYWLRAFISYTKSKWINSHTHTNLWRSEKIEPTEQFSFISIFFWLKMIIKTHLQQLYYFFLFFGLKLINANIHGVQWFNKSVWIQRSDLITYESRLEFIYDIWTATTTKNYKRNRAASIFFL